MITGITAISSIILGTGVAYAADRYPTYRARLETAGGSLIIVGFGIIGFALQVALRHP